MNRSQHQPVVMIEKHGFGYIHDFKNEQLLLSIEVYQKKIVIEISGYSLKRNKIYYQKLKKCNLSTENWQERDSESFRLAERLLRELRVDASLVAAPVQLAA